MQPGTGPTSLGRQQAASGMQTQLRHLPCTTDALLVCMNNRKLAALCWPKATRTSEAPHLPSAMPAAPLPLPSSRQRRPCHGPRPRGACMRATESSHTVRTDHALCEIGRTRCSGCSSGLSGHLRPLSAKRIQQGHGLRQGAQRNCQKTCNGACEHWNVLGTSDRERRQLRTEGQRTRPVSAVRRDPDAGLSSCTPVQCAGRGQHHVARLKGSVALTWRVARACARVHGIKAKVGVTPDSEPRFACSICGRMAAPGQCAVRRLQLAVLVQVPGHTTSFRRQPSCCASPPRMQARQPTCSIFQQQS